MKTCGEQPFRLMLIFYDELATLQAIPLNGVPDPAGCEKIGGMVRGKEDLLSLLSDIGIDSVAQTRQMATLDQEPPRFVRIFTIQTPSQIIDYIEARFGEGHAAEMRFIESDTLLELDPGPNMEEIVLGATKLTPGQGFQLMMDWFIRRTLV